MRLDGIQTGQGTIAAIVHDLSRAPDHARANHIATSNFPTADAHLLGQSVEHALHGELGLVGAKATKGTADWVVGAHGDGLNINCRHVIGAAGMAGHALEHFHANTRIGPRITDSAHAQAGQHTSVVTPERILHANRMALGVHQQTFFARQHALNGCVNQPSGQRSMRLVRHVFFATKSAAVRHQRDSDGFVWHAEHSGDVVAIVPDTLSA